jgi:outer membrane protease
MPRLHAAAAILLLSIAPQSAQPGPEISFGINGGFLFGVARELVFGPSGTVSELDWDLKPAYYLGLSVEALFPNGLHLEAEYKAAVPARLGSVSDYDWDEAGNWTNYSNHEAWLEDSVLLDLHLGREYRLGGERSTAAVLEAFIGMGAMHFSWTGRNGYLQYPVFGGAITDLSSVPRTPVFGTVFLYSQTYIYPLFGLSLSSPPGRLGLKASLAASPLVYCSDSDSHIIRLIEFSETMLGFFYIEPELSAWYSLSEGATLRLDLGGRYTGRLQGDSSLMPIGTQGMTNPWDPSYTTGVRKLYPGSGGASMWDVEAALYLEMRL